MTTRPVVLPPGSHAAAPRDRSAGLRRGLVLLAIALTAMAGPLGRVPAEQAPGDEVFRPGTITSVVATATR